MSDYRAYAATVRDTSSRKYTPLIHQARYHRLAEAIEALCDERNRARDLAAALEGQLAEATTLLRETCDELNRWIVDRFYGNLPQASAVVEAVAKVDEFLGRIDAAQPPIRADSDPPV